MDQMMKLTETIDATPMFSDGNEAQQAINDNNQFVLDASRPPGSDVKEDDKFEEPKGSDAELVQSPNFIPTITTVFLFLSKCASSFPLSYDLARDLLEFVFFLCVDCRKYSFSTIDQFTTSQKKRLVEELFIAIPRLASIPEDTFNILGTESAADFRRVLSGLQFLQDEIVSKLDNPELNAKMVDLLQSEFVKVINHRLALWKGTCEWDPKEHSDLKFIPPTHYWYLEKQHEEKTNAANCIEIMEKHTNDRLEKKITANAQLTEDAAVTEEKDKIYEVRKGMVAAYIIGASNYTESDLQLSEYLLLGVDADVSNLWRFFYTRLECDSKICLNQPAEEIRKEFKEWSMTKEVREASIIFVALAGHGNDGIFIASDGNPINISEDIVQWIDNLHCPSNNPKPRIILNACCRGGLEQVGNKYEDPEGLHMNSPRQLTFKANPNEGIRATKIVPALIDVLFIYSTSQHMVATETSKGNSFLNLFLKVCISL
ncbi:hypothetical protein WR25_14061 isoform C [Diploscapter pachys]|nr:hypothetical protein WR25_14061 isoform B [Diploscapter pachys]PAV60593.1 hypothetical protein WR25_14061 isoform C [Diploscapter pachys]